MTKKELKAVERWKERLHELSCEADAIMEGEDYFKQESNDYYNGRISGIDSAIWWFEQFVEREMRE